MLRPLAATASRRKYLMTALLIALVRVYQKPSPDCSLGCAGSTRRAPGTRSAAWKSRQPGSLLSFVRVCKMPAVSPGASTSPAPRRPSGGPLLAGKQLDGPQLARSHPSDLRVILLLWKVVLPKFGLFGGDKSNAQAVADPPKINAPDFAPDPMVENAPVPDANGALHVRDADVVQIKGNRFAATLSSRGGAHELVLDDPQYGGSGKGDTADLVTSSWDAPRRGPTSSAGARCGPRSGPTSRTTR